jgi:hypothetical protein
MLSPGNISSKPALMPFMLNISSGETNLSQSGPKRKPDQRGGPPLLNQKRKKEASNPYFASHLYFPSFILIFSCGAFYKN